MGEPVRVPEPESADRYLGDARVWKFESKSRPGKFHYVIIGKLINICTCEAYQYKNECPHTHPDVLARLVDEEAKWT